MFGGGVVGGAYHLPGSFLHSNCMLVPVFISAGVGLADDLNDLSFAFGKAPFLREVPGVLNLNALHVLSGEELVLDEQGRPREVGLRKLASM